MLMPGCPCTNDSASAARVPVPLRRPARRRRVGAAAFFLAFLAPFAGFAAFAGFAGAAAARLPLTEPRGRPGPRRRGVAVAAAGGAARVDPPTVARGGGGGSRRPDPSTAG